MSSVRRTPESRAVVRSETSITGDTPTITVPYSGGGETHPFTLVASDAFMESHPVQLEVSPDHNANGDPCERWGTEPYHFDLTPLKMMFRETYQEDAGTLSLLLEDVPGFVHEIAPSA